MTAKRDNDESVTIKKYMEDYTWMSYLAPTWYVLEVRRNNERKDTFAIWNENQKKKGLRSAIPSKAKGTFPGVDLAVSDLSDFQTWGRLMVSLTYHLTDRSAYHIIEQVMEILGYRSVTDNLYMPLGLVGHAMLVLMSMGRLATSFDPYLQGSPRTDDRTGDQTHLTGAQSSLPDDLQNPPFDPNASIDPNAQNWGGDSNDPNSPWNPNAPGPNPPTPSAPTDSTDDLQGTGTAV